MDENPGSQDVCSYTEEISTLKRQAERNRTVARRLFHLTLTLIFFSCFCVLTFATSWIRHELFMKAAPRVASTYTLLGLDQPTEPRGDE